LIPALHALKNFEGLTGTFSWNAVGERTGSPYVAFEVMSNGGYKITYPPEAVTK
jgi:branched-chain amino acid transport system substrate-binding protein